MLMLIKKIDVFNLQIISHAHTHTHKKENTVTSKDVLPKIFTIPQFYKMKLHNMPGSFTLLGVYISYLNH